MNSPAYLHLHADQPLPRLEGVRPFKAVLIIEVEVTPDWRALVSDWLVRSGCLYMMAWGRGCSEWDDSVDHANLNVFDYGEIPDDSFVMTTWHEHDSLPQVFWYCEHSAFHPTVDLERTLIIHVSPNDRREELLETFLGAQNE
jgi:hypothetical protein